MVDVYATASTLVDSGEVSSIRSLDIDEKPFQLAFVRGASFRFEFHDTAPKDSYVVWWDGTTAKTSWSARPGIQATTLALAIAGATGVSRGSAHTIPRMLLPDDVSGFALTQLANLEVVGTEQIDKHACWKKVLGTGRLDTSVVLWIDQTSYLLRQMTRQTPPRGNLTFPLEITKYHPILDQPVDPSLLASP